MFKNKRFTLWLTIGLVLALLLIYAILPDPILVDGTRVKKANISEVITEIGETRVKEVFTISAPITGTIKRIRLKVGDSVIANQTVLAEIEPLSSTLLDNRTQKQTEAQYKSSLAALAVAKAKLAQLSTELKHSEKEFLRGTNLLKEEVISQQNYDQLEKQYVTLQQEFLVAQSSLKMSQFEVERIRAILEPPQTSSINEQCACVEIKASIDGVILQRYQISAGVIASGQAIMDIGDPGQLEIMVELTSNDAVQVESGQEVEIDGWGGPQLKGLVNKVEPLGFTKITALGIEEQRAKVIIDIISSAELWARLGHGYQIDANIILQKKQNTLTIPVISMFRDGNSWAVFKIEDGKAIKQTIMVGIINGLRAEVTEGLQENDSIIYNPNQTIQDGIAVEVRSDII